VSGEPSVFLVGPFTSRLVAALGDLTEVEPRFVLVGGLAVMARLAEAHRATQDLDTLVTGIGFTTAVAALPSGRSEHGVLSVGNVKVDTIEIDLDTTWDEIAEVDAPIDRLFTGAHLWAMRTAAPLRISAGDAWALVPVASVAALLAMKLHAYSSTRRNPDKRPGDALDVLRLGRMLAQASDAEPVAAPPVVADAVRWAITSWHESPSEVVRRLRGLGAHAPRLDEAEVRALAELLLDAFAA
jgi:hypothetical protein